MIAGGVGYSASDFGEKYQSWGNTLALLMSVTPGVAVPLYAIGIIIYTKYYKKQPLGPVSFKCISIQFFFVPYTH